MDLGLHVEYLQRLLAVAAEAGGEEAQAVAAWLAAPLDSAIRLTLQDAVTQAAEEITVDLAPGAVEVRLRGRELEFVVTAPPAEAPASDAGDSDAGPMPPVEGDDGSLARINLRLPEHLKARVEQAAGRDGLSVNAWLVRAAAAGLERTDPDRRRGPRTSRGTQHYTGWAR